MIRRAVLIVTICSLVLALGACSSAPKQQDIAEADFGKPMTATEMQASADRYLVRVLKDPESRRVDWLRSGKAWSWNHLWGSSPKYGYGLEASVNAKNSLGGYTGGKLYFFFFRDGLIVEGDQVRPKGVYDTHDPYGFAP